jgi:hypothetical protein
MRKRLVSFSDRQNAFLRGESERLEMSVSGLIRGIIEFYMNSDYKGKPKQKEKKDEINRKRVD